MAVPSQSTRFGRIYPPDEAWLAKATEEVVIEPNLPIIDTHHHLWQRPDHRYLLHELLDDLGRGHNVTATVFLQCHAMYRTGGPGEMHPIGETEFVAGIASMSDSGGYGPTKVAAGIVGFADLTLGERALVAVPIALMFVLGLWPRLVLDVINPTVVRMVEQLKF